MPCQTGLAECLVRIQIAKEQYGSGVILERGLILTCAHVIDHGYTAAAYDDETTQSTRIKANTSLRARVGSQVATVTLYDGSVHGAELIAVDDAEDMVLLRAAAVEPFNIHAPIIASNLILKKNMALTALGFAKADEHRFTVRSASLSSMVDEDETGGAYTKAFAGEISKGMSGGLVCHVASHAFTIVGMNVLGDDLGDYCRLIRDRDILKFLAAHSHLLNRAGKTGSSTEFGLADRLMTQLSPASEPLQWVRMTPREHSLTQAGRSVSYLSDRPLTAGDADWLLAIERPPSLADARRSFLAEFTADEAQRAIRLLAERTGLPVEIPRHDGLAAIADSLKPVPTQERERLVASERNNLPTEKEEGLQTRRGFRVFPDTKREWQNTAPRGDLDRVVYRGDRDAWLSESSFPIGVSASMRAFLRPALRFPVWSDLA